MQVELDALGVDVKIQSINQIAAESGTDSLTEDMNLPMVQDTEAADVWTDWEAAWRDVYLVDTDNLHIGTYNLTEHDLGDPDNYETLKAMFVDAAESAR
jgi:hypothetical protein